MCELHVFLAFARTAYFLHLEADGVQSREREASANIGPLESLRQFPIGFGISYRRHGLFSAGRISH